MRGDFTRSTHSPPKRYSGVRMQQGRVQLDADWNEQLDIQARHDRVEARDVIGPSGVPKTGGGFGIGVTPDGSDLTISPGRLYVDGVLCELFATPVAVTAASGATLTLEALAADGRAFETGQWVEVTTAGTRTLHQIATVDGPGAGITVTPAAASAAAGSSVRRVATLAHQPDLPPPSGDDPSAGRYLVYADVWERMITGVEDPGILEPALGGPDTAVRTKTLAQVRIVDAAEAAAALDADDGTIDCSTFGDGWAPADALSTGRLRARAEADPAGDDPCVVPPRAGYRGLENQLYRIEVHDGSEATGGATYKWSRDNASTHAVVVESIVGKVVTVADAGRDAETGFATARWIELVDEAQALEGLPGTMVEVAKVEDREITVASWPSSGAPVLGAGAVARRWDGGPRTLGEEKVEQGVEVEFDGGVVRSGDWWLVPARTRIGDVLWPVDELTGQPLWEGRQGTTHRYAPLALVTLGSKWDPATLTDCRKPFPPLTDLPKGGGGCCVAVAPGEDVQAAIDAVIEAGGGCVSLCPGRHDVEGPLHIRRAAGLRLHGTTPATQLRLAGSDESGYGGIVVTDATDVAVEDMLVVGARGVPALVTLTSERDGVSSAVRLAGLTLLQPAEWGKREGDEEGRVPTCAVALEAARDVAIESCRMVAPVGVLAGPGANARWLAEEHGFGALLPADRVRIDACTIRFGRSGIEALRAHDWDVRACRIGPLGSDTLLERVHASLESGEEPKLGLLRVVESLLEAAPGAPRGAAVYAITWVRSSLRECRLTGARAVEVAGWVGGGAFDNVVLADGHGLHAMGVAGATWRGNRIECRGGVACSFGAVWRIRVEGNTIVAGLGVANVRTGTLARRVVRELRQGAFGSDAILAFVRDLPEAVGLGDAFERFEGLLQPGAVGGLLTKAVEGTLPRVLEWRHSIALVGVRVEGNEIDSSAGGVFLHQFPTIGGATIARNRISCDRGTAVRVDSGYEYYSPESIVGRLGAGGEAGIRRRFRRSAEEFVQEMDDQFGLASSHVRPLAYRVQGLAADLLLEALDLDYRIEGNAVLSLLTGIEANVTGVAIAGNEVVLAREDELREDAEEAAEAFEKSEFMVAAALALRTGDRAEGAATAAELGAASARADGEEIRTDAAAAAGRLASRARSRRLRRMGRRLVDSVGSDVEAAARAIANFVTELTAVSASRGIVATGDGAWILDNRVAAPSAERDTGVAPQGGVLVRRSGAAGDLETGTEEASDAEGGSGDKPTVAHETIDVAALRARGRLGRWAPGLARGDVLIARNRVSGGTADGIEVVGGSGSGIVAIRENTIGDMARAGVIAGREAFGERFEVDGNSVTGCGGRRLHDLVPFDVTVVVLGGRHAAVTGNAVETPLGGDFERQGGAGILLQGVATATISRNRVTQPDESQEALGIAVVRCGDSIAISDNQVEMRRGGALFWYASAGEHARSETAAYAADSYLRMVAGHKGEIPLMPGASIVGNRFDAAESVCVYVTAPPRLSFTGNSLSTGWHDGFGLVAAASSLVFSSNTLSGPHSLGVRARFRASVVANVSDVPIVMTPPPFSGLREAGLNVPSIAGSTV